MRWQLIFYFALVAAFAAMTLAGCSTYRAWRVDRGWSDMDRAITDDRATGYLAGVLMRIKAHIAAQRLATIDMDAGFDRQQADIDAIAEMRRRAAQQLAPAGATDSAIERSFLLADDEACRRDEVPDLFECVMQPGGMYKLKVKDVKQGLLPARQEPQER